MSAKKDWILTIGFGENASDEHTKIIKKAICNTINDSLIWSWNREASESEVRIYSDSEGWLLRVIAEVIRLQASSLHGLFFDLRLMEA